MTKFGLINAMFDFSRGLVLNCNIVMECLIFFGCFLSCWQTLCFCSSSVYMILNYKVLFLLVQVAFFLSRVYTEAEILRHC